MLGIPYKRGKHDLTIDWTAMLEHGCKLKHKQRRKLFKKMKRSCKRRTTAAGDCVENQECSSSDDEKQPGLSFYETVAALRKARKLILPINNPAFSNTFVANISGDKPPTDQSENLLDMHQNETFPSSNDGVVLNEAVVKSSSKEDDNTDHEEDEVTVEDHDFDNVSKDIEITKLLEDLDAEVKEWHNPFLPDTGQNSKQNTNSCHSSDVSHLPTSNDVPRENNNTSSKPICQFYEKVGSCRFGDHCSRYHKQVSSSDVLLLHGMFTTFAFDMLRRTQKNGNADDLSLEHSDADLFDEFIEFFDDVLPELESYGKVRQFKVCCNRSHHLLGNVYVQYQNENEAKRAAEVLNGRFYGGKRLHAQFISIKSWKNAICGLHYNNRTCPRGNQCNFLHVFKHPSKRYRVDTELQRTSKHRDHHHVSKNYDYGKHRRHDYSPRKRSPSRRTSYRHSSSRGCDSPTLKRHKKESKKHKKKSKKIHKKDHKHKKNKKSQYDL